MSRPLLEVADIFHRHGAAWRTAHAGHLSLGQLKVMAAIENCRTAALGGHVEACEDCGHSRIAYNSCRNRHCPRCQGAAAREWLAARQADLLPVGYFHVVFTLPVEVADIAYHNKAVIYGLLFHAAAQAMLTIAADPKHLGARIGITAVLHTWGSAMTHHPHVHMIVPGGGIALDGERWVSCRPGFLLPVRVLSRLFRRLFLAKLTEAHAAGRLTFFGDHARLSEHSTFVKFLVPLRKKNWFVYAKSPFAGPEAVLAYLSRYTHRVAISNSRLIALDQTGVTFRVKDYRRDGHERYRTMTLDPDEFIRRFLLHVLPKGFHRIRHYGLLASAGCAENIARARMLLATPQPEISRSDDGDTAAQADWRPSCPCCGGRMIIIETFEPDNGARAPPSAASTSGAQTP
ncbi:IS91 family transposase [Rhizobium leguminosarum]|uniref:IS91 family transposase n=1 Tax=Rhizobium leguminosarum TaxID=384 RepID=UPI001442817E|nr:IS91 family transposase [Rhizobium leguminosarum]NKL79361.1 IS91 family transposase [Rhizobium leguminosarum bv. viciae]